MSNVQQSAKWPSVPDNVLNRMRLSAPDSTFTALPDAAGVNECSSRLHGADRLGRLVDSADEVVLDSVPDGHIGDGRPAARHRELALETETTRRRVCDGVYLRASVRLDPLTEKDSVAVMVPVPKARSPLVLVVTNDDVSIATLEASCARASLVLAHVPI